MKILMTTDNIGGVWTFSLLLANGLKRHGADVTLAIIGDPLTSSQRMELKGIPYYSIIAKQEWMESPWDDVSKTGRWLLSLKKFLQPDIIHLNSFSLGSLQWGSPVVMTIHSCVLSWWEAVKNEYAPVEWSIYQRHIGEGLRNANMVVAPSKAMMDAAEKYYQPFQQKEVIYNGGNSSLFESDVKEDFVFSMGRIWDEAKNIRLVIEAAPYIDYPIYVAGDTTGVDISSLPGNVHLLGKITSREISAWLSKAAIYLLPVKYEPFGYSFLEAAFSKCMIITGDIASAREIWDGTVAYANTSDHRKLASMVNDTMKDKNYRETMAERAYERAIQKYTVGEMTAEYLALYNEQEELFVNQSLKLQMK